jgi:hypothetical protein
MTKEQLTAWMTALGLDKASLAALIRMTERGIQFWLDGQREIPGWLAPFLAAFSMLGVEQRAKLRETGVEFANVQPTAVPEDAIPVIEGIKGLLVGRFAAVVTQTPTEQLPAMINRLEIMEERLGIPFTPFRPHRPLPSNV